MEKDFIIPEEGTVAITDAQGNVSARKDMVFSFSGDDDAWLFVDGQLVLDMGGIHEAVSGSINFTKGTFTVTSSVTGDTRTQALSSVFADYPEAIGQVGGFCMGSRNKAYLQLLLPGKRRDPV